jgi:signal transduction histidine kinase
MRVSHKLSLLTAAGITVVLGLDGYSRVRREISLFEDDMRRDHEVLARTLSVAATSVASGGHQDAALRLIADADAERSYITIRWVPSSPTAAPATPLRTHIETAHDASDRYMVTRVHLSLEGEGDGMIELRETLADEHEYIRATVVHTVVATAETILVCVVIIVAIGWLLVGRPMGAIMSLVRAVAGGDFSGRVHVRQGGEMGELARELTSMCERLSEARTRAAQEAQSRIAALEQLRHADRLSTVGKLASGIAHELGTPLNVVSARAKMIERGETRGDEVVDDARSIREQAERMTRIIRQLLDFARRKHPDKQPTEIGALVRRVVELLATLARKRSVALEVEVEGEPLVATVDVGQTEQVVTNLVMNGIQAQPDGGAVRVAVRAGGAGAVEIAVQDDGPGMPDEVKERVFEPFFTTKDVGEGTGLGLSVVYGIVEEHGGRIDVSSGPGKGTRFVVSLPVGEV